MAITTTPPDAITPPTSTDPSNFRVRADAFMAWLQTFAAFIVSFISQLNSTEENINSKEASAVSASVAAVASANFQGTWVNQLTAVGQSWNYAGIIYRVLVAGTASPITTPSNWVALSIAQNIKKTPNGLILSTEVESAINELATKAIPIFTKPHQGAPLFTKASVSTITIPIGTSVKVGANIITVSGTAYTLSLNSVAVGALDTGTKAAGTDYYVYALEAGGFILSINGTNPTGYTTANSRKIGGFHYGVIPEAFGAINNITASEATGLAGIEKDSFWDLKWMPNNLNNDPRGMRYALGMWVDIYILNTNHHLYGTSAAGKTIAGGAVLNGRNFPKIPLKFGGDGTTTYGTLTWFEAAEIGKAYGKRLLSYEEFVALAYGVLEASSAGATDTGVTQHLANYTSKFGLCMATGCQYIWSRDTFSDTSGTYVWTTNTEGRGSIYSVGNNPKAAIFGGSRDYTVESGSRASAWHNYVWATSWGIGARFACDHLELA